MLKVLRENFQLAIVVILCSCAVVGITPFAVIRALSQEWILALIDSGIVIGMSTLLVIALRSSRLQLVSTILTIFYTTGGVIMTHLQPVTAGYWLYPIFVANFFILSASWAGAINLAAFLALIPSLSYFQESLQFFEFSVTLFLVSVFGWVFGWRTNDQRQQLQQQAVIDPLTNLGNRRKLAQYLETLVVGKTLVFNGSAVLIDLDNFKEINDNHGHDQGDDVLRQVAEIIHAVLRTSKDDVYRYGGEEFLLLIHNASIQDAIRVSESLRIEIAEHFKSQGLLLTASFGCAEHQDDETWSQWIKRADVALYQAKDAGRNCVRPRL